ISIPIEPEPHLGFIITGNFKSSFLKAMIASSYEMNVLGEFSPILDKNSEVLYPACAGNPLTLDIQIHYITSSPHYMSFCAFPSQHI
ncbi:MAG: hypothetical protein IIW84_00470, partial [Selenomonadaceae bacterium]|nr:hypothetical protein [Selenomonadaceae bacterium]